MNVRSYMEENHMNSLSLDARAKINLSLDIPGRRGDGYHEIDTVMQSISLCDRVTLRRNHGGLSMICPPGIPAGESNTAFRAAQLFAAYTNDPTALDIDIVLEKFIPSGAGLGGGSADAAAVLRGLNLLSGCACSEDELCAMGAKVGADVPFCVLGKTRRCTGIGEKMVQIQTQMHFTCVLCKPQVSVSTADAYRLLDKADAFHTAFTPGVCAALEQNDLRQLAAACGNVFETVITHPQIDAIRKIMLQNGALCAHMSGSGSAVYGVFESPLEAKGCLGALMGLGEIFLCDTV